MTEVIWHVREYHTRPVAFVFLPNGCWQWLGGKQENGYGRTTRRGSDCLAHRFVYRRLRGEIPEGLTLDHLCRNRLCVNPDHLEPVTAGENVLRGVGPCAVNARKTHCHKGHPLSGDNLYVKPNGRRRCRICSRENARQHWPEHYDKHREMYRAGNRRRYRRAHGIV